MRKADINQTYDNGEATDPRSCTSSSSSSSRPEGGLVRGGQERVDTFRARMEPGGFQHTHTC